MRHPTQLQEIKDKVKKTNNERFGQDYYTQTKEYHKTAHKPYINSKYPDMTFGSSWEFKVYDFLMEHHIEFEYQPDISFEYEYDGKTHTYHSDFKIGDRIYEVKGDHFFNESGQMVNPYDHSQDGLYEAKHQCMLKNNVVILKHQDINKLSFELFKW